jgi:uncharacterized membrane protein
MKKIGRKLGGYLLQGIFVTAPIGVTAYIIYAVFTFLDGLLRRFLDPLLGVHIPGIGLLSIIVLITLLGYLTQTIVFRPVRKTVMRLMNKAPLLKVIYSAIRDLLSAFVGKEKKFTEPVLVLIHPPSNLEKLGFVTQTDLAILGIRVKKVAVYFPHSYNFSGELFIVPAENVKPLDLPSAEVMKFIVSGGVANL